jgi:MFS transporter, DHA1 family, inner membrane transport protein
MPGYSRAMNAASRAGLASLAVSYFVLGTGSLAIVGLLDPMAADFGVHPADVAQLVTVFAVTFAIAATGLQVIVGRLPRRSLLLGGLATMSAGALGSALAPSLGWAVAARVVMALGAAAVGPMASALGAGMVPKQEQARALSLVFGGLIVATVLGVPLATWAGHVLSWRGVFVVLALMGLACIPAAATFVRDRSPGTSVGLATLGGLLARRSVGLGLLLTLLQSAAQFATYALVAVLLTERFGVTPQWLSLSLLLFGLGGILGNWLGGTLGDRAPPRRLIAVSIGGMTLTFVLLGFAPRVAPLAIVLLGCWAVLAMLFQAPQQKRLMGLAPGFGTVVLAANSSALYLGMSLGTLCATQAYRSWGSGSLPLVSAALMGIAATALRLSEPRGVAAPAT